jgi:hypothetical protein
VNPLSPAFVGFRCALRHPGISLAEITWRWTFAAAVWFLGTIFFIEYMGNLPVTALDRLLLASRQPALIERALHRIFAGSAVRFTVSGVLLASGLAIAWIVLASLGRAATVNSAAHELGIVADSNARPIATLLTLNFLRAAVSLAAVAGIVGSIVVASSFWASSHASVARAGQLVGIFWFLVWMTWGFLNWLLSLAGVFAVVKPGVTSALVSAAGLVIERTGAVFSLGMVFGIAHFGVFVATFGAAATTAGLTGTLGPGFVIVLESLIAIAYCAVADFLYTSRMIAYISMLREDELPAPIPSEDLPLDGRSGSVDQSELILSDLPAAT